MTSSMTVHVTADDDLDARDKARRQAERDGYRALKEPEPRVVRVGGDPHRSRQWAVTLAVVPL